MKKSYVIGLSGGSGSGKTTFLKDLCQKFSTSELAVLTQDNYYKPRHEQKEDENGVINFDVPEAIDVQKFANDLKELKNGNSIQKEEYTFNNSAKEAAMIEVRSSPVIVTEGLFVFHCNEIAELLDYKIFFYADPQIRLDRRIKRDQIERGYPASDVNYRWRHHVRPADLEYLDPYQNTCDLEIRNNIDFNKELVHLEELIRSKLA